MEEMLANESVEETTEVESAPTETNASEETQTAEKPTQPTEPIREEKTVPLRVLQDERKRRKDAEEYIKTITQLPPEQPQYEEPAEQQEPYLPPNVMTRDEYEFREREKRAWDEVKSEIPEAKENPKIVEMAEAYRQASIIQGRGYMTAKEATNEIVSLLKEAQVKGQKSSQDSVEYIKRQSLEDATVSRKNDDSETIEALKEKTSSRNKKVSDSALLELIKSGKI